MQIYTMQVRINAASLTVQRPHVPHVYSPCSIAVGLKDPVLLRMHLVAALLSVRLAVASWDGRRLLDDGLVRERGLAKT